jgi:HlyD family secretion protein
MAISDTAEGARADVERTLGIGTHAPKRAWKRVAVAACLLAVVAGGAVAFARGRGGPPAPRFETVKAARATLSVTVTATGTLQGVGTIEVGAEVTGRVMKILVDYNDAVEPGQLLAVIDPEPSQAGFDQAAASVAAAVAAIAQAQATVDETAAALARAEEQARAGIGTQRDLEAARAASLRAKAQHASAVANATVARASLKSARSKLDKTKIVSPVRGTVLTRLIEPGQTVTAGFQTPVLFKLTEDLRKMKLSVYVDEADVGRVKEGFDASFTVDAYPGRTFPSKVQSIHNQAKSESGVVSYEAILAADNADLSLRPGMTATATIVADKREGVLLVPNTALRFTPPVERKGFGPPGAPAPRVDGPHVHVLEQGAPKVVLLEVGATDGTSTEVRSGPLEVGADVIVDIKEGP